MSGRKRKVEKDVIPLIPQNIQYNGLFPLPTVLVDIIAEYARIYIIAFQTEEDNFSFLTESEVYDYRDGEVSTWKRRMEIADNTPCLLRQSIHVGKMAANTNKSFYQIDGYWTDFPFSDPICIVRYNGSTYEVSVFDVRFGFHNTIISNASDIILSDESILALFGVEYWRVEIYEWKWIRIL